MAEIICNDCGKAKDDYFYCGTCYESLQEKIEQYENKISTLADRLSFANSEIARLEEINGQTGKN